MILSKIKSYIKLMRVKHYIKNVLVLVSLFFSKNIFVSSKLIPALIGVVCFCLISSSVYIINDLNDVEKDRKHPTKRMRPIASGAVSKSEAITLFMICTLGSCTLSFFIGSPLSVIFIVIYLLLNIAYSFGLKNYPILDIAILTSGFVLRVLYGAFVTGTIISNWLFLVIVTGSLYLGLGKRRNEFKLNADSREVLKHYNYAFLDKNMHVCLGLVNVFYVLWAKEFKNPYMLYTVPLVIIIFMKYSLDIEGDSDGDPVEVVVKDKVLVALSAIYAITVAALLYVV